MQTCDHGGQRRAKRSQDERACARSFSSAVLLGVVLKLVPPLRSDVLERALSPTRARGGTFVDARRGKRSHRRVCDQVRAVTTAAAPIVVLQGRCWPHHGRQFGISEALNVWPYRCLIRYECTASSQVYTACQRAAEPDLCPFVPRAFATIFC